MEVTRTATPPAPGRAAEPGASLRVGGPTEPRAAYAQLLERDGNERGRKQSACSAAGAGVAVRRRIPPPWPRSPSAACTRVPDKRS